MNEKLFAYEMIDTPVHNLSGITKLIGFLLLTFAIMLSYDPRVILLIFLFSLYVLKKSEIKYEDIRGMLIYVFSFIILNAIFTFLFAPEEGVKIYESRHEIAHLFGNYYLTKEQIFYQLTKMLKYISVVPLGIIFIFTTHPSEFASSLNRVGVGYNTALAVSLTLRYFPDLLREYREISLSQQARGLEMSKKAKMSDRLKNSMGIVLPLIFSSLDRIEMISNAMDLRGFGKHKTRTWYSAKDLESADYRAIIISVVIFIASILVSIFINQSRFYNPFL